RDRSAVVGHADAAPRDTGADPSERQPGGATERLRARGPEASWHGHEQLVLLSAPHGCEWRDTRPAGNALQLDRNSDARRRRDMSRVTRQAVGDVEVAIELERVPCWPGDAGHVAAPLGVATPRLVAAATRPA